MLRGSRFEIQNSFAHSLQLFQKETKKKKQRERLNYSNLFSLLKYLEWNFFCWNQILIITDS